MYKSTNEIHNTIKYKIIIQMKEIYTIMLCG